MATNFAFLLLQNDIRCSQRSSATIHFCHDNFRLVFNQFNFVITGRACNLDDKIRWHQHVDFDFIASIIVGDCRKTMIGFQTAISVHPVFRGENILAIAAGYSVRGPHGQLVFTFNAKKHIFILTAVKRIIAYPAIKRITAFLAQKLIIACVAVQCVCALATRKSVRPSIAIH